MSCEEQGEEEIQELRKINQREVTNKEKANYKGSEKVEEVNRVLFGFPLTLRHFSSFDTSFSL